MMGKKTNESDIDWVNLVKMCCDDPNNFTYLFKSLKPSLLKIANSVASQIVDDAVQVAFIKIWKKIDHVDITRPGSVKPYLLTMATRAMKDEVSLYLRRSLKQVNLGIDDQGRDIINSLPDKKMYDVLSFDRPSGILGEYIKYIEKNHTLNGAHTAIAKDLGINLSDVVGAFNKEIGKLNKRRKYESLINKLIGEK